MQGEQPSSQSYDAAYLQSLTVRLAVSLACCIWCLLVTVSITHLYRINPLSFIVQWIIPIAISVGLAIKPYAHGNRKVRLLALGTLTVEILLIIFVCYCGVASLLHL